VRVDGASNTRRIFFAPERSAELARCVAARHDQQQLLDAAAPVGRDAAVAWMTVAAIPARDWALQSEPTWSSIAIGIGFHQWADFQVTRN
jgi:hypothetical protein